MEVRSSLIKPMRNGKRAHEIRAPTTRPDNIHSIPGAYRVKERNSYRLCSEHTSNEHTQNLVKIKKKPTKHVSGTISCQLTPVSPFLGRARFWHVKKGPQDDGAEGYYSQSPRICLV